MKSLLLSFLLIFNLALSYAQTDEEAVKETINRAYVGGIHNGGPIADIRKGFHPSFIMFVLNNDQLKATTLDEWVTNIEKARSSNATTPASPAVAKFQYISIVGTSASVVLELYRGEKRIFTDNLLLYKFADGWRIVAKNFYRH